MAVRAYVLIEAEPNSEAAEIVSALRGMSRTESAEAVTGPHDIIAIVSATDLEALGEAREEIHQIPGVARTMTCVAVQL